MSSISSRLGLIASFALAAVAATPGSAAAWAPTTLDCDNIIPWFQSNNYGWWWGALGNCKKGPGGPTGFDAVFDCAFKQVEDKYKKACPALEAELRGAPNTRVGVDVVSEYNGMPTCAYVMSYYTRSNFAVWQGALRSQALGAGRGSTDPATIFDVAFHSLPKPHQQDCLSDLLHAVPVTDAVIADVVSLNTPGACPGLIAAYQANNHDAWWRALGSVKRRGGPSTREAIFNAAFLSLPAGDQQPCLRAYLTSAPVTDRGVLEVRAFNGIPTSLANDRRTELSEPQEVCSVSTTAPDYMAPSIPYPFLESDSPFKPPGYNIPAGQNLGSDEGRLVPDLRQVARLADPIDCALPLAAHSFAAANGTTSQGDLVALGQAYADLAVTGSKAFAAFNLRRPTEDDYCNAIEERESPPGCLPFASVSDDDLREGCRTALKRAYRVANFLRVGQALRAEGPWFNGNGTSTPLAAAEKLRKATERLALGWIAVSGEDDAPHRPVNVPSSDYPQYTIKLSVNAPYQLLGVETDLHRVPVQVTARYTIAQSRAPATRPIYYDAGSNPYFLDEDPVPTIAKGSKVLLFVHGMDSRAEEATDITRELFARMTEGETNLVLIAVDLPSSGYTQSLDYDRVSRLNVIGTPFGNADFTATGLTPLLDFLEDFVVTFVETLPANLAVPASMVAVMGGSLGGNLTFRLGRRANAPWIKNVVVWSPASIWTSMGEGNDLFVHGGPRKTWFYADDRNASDPDDLGAARLSRRKGFFVDGWDTPILDPIIPYSQPMSWTGSFYPCKLDAIAGSRMDRQETYNPKFLSWRWRLAAEQLLYSHQTFEPATGQRGFMRNDKPMLLACGTEDDVFGNEICDATRLTAEVMTLTPGRARYLPDTGHSVDAERPRYFARKMDEFLGLH